MSVIEIPVKVYVYISSIQHNKTIKTISFDQQRELELNQNPKKLQRSTPSCVIEGAKIHKQQTHCYKIRKTKNGTRQMNTKHILPNYVTELTK
ncbi:hypothetical protein CWI38_0632p0010 [Hamiltosporidium tvaerminnensis]|uniref:Uncharacterized protein n=1 Tax=Hamiltosporidium tvaerminnensis TaxID=1176355 RepID=A0A4Q9LVP3_9MICR|nr:hypothetical protein CWI38_0632p0010 [Hamiltosporidium tvaerminnensis]